MALWRSWLARRPVTAEVAGSSPVRVASFRASFRYSGGWLLRVRRAVNFWLNFPDICCGQLFSILLWAVILAIW